GSRQEAGRITAHARAAFPTAISGLVQPDSRRPYYAYQVCRPFVSFVTFVSFISERSDPKGQIRKVRSERSDPKDQIEVPSENLLPHLRAGADLVQRRGLLLVH